MFTLRNKRNYNLIYRCSILVWMACKFLVQIYAFHFIHSIWDERTRKKWDRLLMRQAKEYRKRAVQLGGVLIKVGQFLSTRTDIMPQVFINELSGLVDKVPPMPYSYAKKLLEEEWGNEIDQVVDYMEEESIASASIGEVYAATLKENGEKVAIKVQRYQIEKIFHMDFIALRIVFWILSVFTSFGRKADLKSLYTELITVMDQELNFHQELDNALYFQTRFKDYPYIHIPNYYSHLCTKKVLVMEWVDGAKVTDIGFMNRNLISVEQTAKRLFEFYADQFLNEGNFHADPHGGNILLQRDGTLSIIDFGMVGTVRKQDIHYFKQIIQFVIMDNYDRVIDVLDEMNFILPNANRTKLKQMIKHTVEMYKNGSFKTLDAHTMEQLKADIRIFIKDQPIQLSAEYAYLGRAMSIVLGILLAIYPDVDLEKWGNRKVKKWFGGKRLIESIYMQYAKDTIEPVFSFPKAMLNWLESGEKDRQWDKKKEQIRLKHHFFVVLEVMLFTLGVISGGVSLLGLSLESTAGIVLFWSSVTCFAGTGLIMIRHYLFLRSEK
ncbi:ABC1 kinase family protein [Oceanobacillus manasiensis]|uniref:ABC1 kinase family protein n=1 Tax=Oceanobacillus manasiensis TaxID=586413 RepID=UPI001E2AD5C9|nr:AarF/UbiB family protein [Oceanobacillus manasiensis]